MRYLYVVLILLFVMAGCGGDGGSDPISISGTGSLTTSDGENVDGSLFDARSFKATRDGWVQIAMNSSALDPYVVAYHGGDDGTEVGHDDDSGSGTNALFYFQAHSGWNYTVKFTTSGEGAHTGQYSYSIREVTSPDDNRAVTMLEPGKQPQDPEMKRTKR